MTAEPIIRLQGAARSNDRAVSLWAVLLIAVAGFALAEANDLATVVGASLVVLAPTRLRFRVGLLALALSTYWLGPATLLLATPAALVAAGRGLPAISAALALAGIGLTAQHFQSVPSLADLPIHLGSLVALAIPSLAVGVAAGRWLGIRGTLSLMAGTAFLLGGFTMAAGVWFGASTITDQTVRLLLACVPAAWAGWNANGRDNAAADWSALAGAAVGMVVALLLAANPISMVVFDESHGKWETIRASFGPDDFGRGVNYTYSLLSGHAERVAGKVAAFDDEAAPLPERDALFVIKMPTQPLSKAFVERLTEWVRAGGRLLVVADHTDLYDSTQNLTPLLARFGYEVTASAVYNPIGGPNVPTTAPGMALLGRIDAHGHQQSWQTGTSFGALPANALRLMTFGMGFEEPGDYSRPNRFGPFLPRIALRYGDHSAVAGSAFGKGAVAVLLDSTPWSNFSMFKAPYTHMLRGVLHALAHPLALAVAGWGGMAMFGLALLWLWRSHRVLSIASGLAIGLSLGAAAQIGWASFAQPVEGRDFGLRVAAGSTAKFEFLKQLVAPGERNYSRIVSAMAKYDLMPAASAPGAEIPRLTDARRWLLIDPDDRQLPSPSDVLAHLQRGGDLTVLFAPEAVIRPPVRAWLNGLLLMPQRATGLAMVEDARPGGLMGRRGAAILRDVRTTVAPLPQSLLKDREADALLQSFTVRPTTFPRISGLLNISFSAEQFSDDAVGEVWDGVRPGVLGRHRERQLAAALLGNELPPPAPEEAVRPDANPKLAAHLRGYLMLENGKKVLEGEFDDNESGPLRLAEAPLAYLADLRNRAAAFVASCPEPGTPCRDRLIGPDMTEWVVSWAAARDGHLAAVELVHERRFSGAGSTWNVVFGE